MSSSSYANKIATSLGIALCIIAVGYTGFQIGSQKKDSKTESKLPTFAFPARPGTMPVHVNYMILNGIRKENLQEFGTGTSTTGGGSMGDSQRIVLLETDTLPTPAFPTKKEYSQLRDDISKALLEVNLDVTPEKVRTPEESGILNSAPDPTPTISIISKMYGTDDSYFLTMTVQMKLQASGQNGSGTKPESPEFSYTGVRKKEHLKDWMNLAVLHCVKNLVSWYKQNNKTGVSLQPGV